MKLGSLFDGSGGFPLAAALCGIEPVWASEIEPYPVRVTKARFPRMKHLGDITKINGAEVEPVDVITFGSPCQDLSIAGARAGMKHEGMGDDETTRSGLFMEAIRIIKEMRKATNGKHPTFAVWENVPGAYSSQRGEDFRVVLEEITRVADTEVSISRSERWRNAGEILADGYSIAWRTLDAQYWGVPQRRKRIFLVADFGGGRAGTVLFESGGLQGYFAPREKAGQETAGDAGANADRAISFKERGGCAGGGKGILIQEEKAAALAAKDGQAVCAGFKAGQGAAAGNIGYMEEQSPTLCGVASGTNQVPAILAFDTTQITSPQNGSNPQYNDACHPLAASAHAPTICVYDARGNGDGKTCPTITGDHNKQISDYTALCIAGNTIDRDPKNGRNHLGVSEEVGFTLNTVDRHAICYPLYDPAPPIDASYYKGTGARNGVEREVIAVCYSDNGAKENNAVAGLDIRNMRENGNISGTLQAKTNGGYSLNYTHPVRQANIVRRLTPLECCRLQGFPDWWCEGVEGSDSAKYKMWGNGIALPCALYVMQGIAEAGRRQKEDGKK